MIYAKEDIIYKCAKEYLPADMNTFLLFPQNSKHSNYDNTQHGIT